MLTKIKNSLHSWVAIASRNRQFLYIAASAAIIWFGLVSIYSALSPWGAFRSALWHGLLFLTTWLFAKSAAGHIANGSSNTQSLVFAHVAAGVGIATFWALFSLASGAALSDWFLEGPIEQIPFFDWLESLFDNTEEYFSSDPGWLAFRWVLGLFVYVTAIVAVRADFAHTKVDALEKRVQLLLNTQISTPDNEIENHLTVNDQGKIRKIAQADLTLLEGERDYVRIHAKERQYLVRFPLRKFETLLDQTAFVRIHRSRIVNINHIEQVSSLGDGRASLTTTNGIQIHTSRQGRKLLKEKWTKPMV